ncbi:MAG: class I SAM-dependent methyltransferase [Candidatus Omnitrophica bacterium]|nr:class I SAM-dependent methyltransferase [Candidatus Omnitrophota bacterium]
MLSSKRIEEELLREEKEAIRQYKGITQIIGITYLLLAEKILDACGSLNGTILDLGTGLGDFAFAVAKKFPLAEVIGLDISEEMLKLEEVQKKGFLNSIKASYLEDELKEMLKEAEVKDFLLEPQRFSRRNILKNLKVLRNTPQRSERFNQLYLNLWIKK